MKTSELVAEQRKIYRTICALISTYELFREDVSLKKPIIEDLKYLEQKLLLFLQAIERKAELELILRNLKECLARGTSSPALDQFVRDEIKKITKELS